jgi:hypothetical protein
VMIDHNEKRGNTSAATVSIVGVTLLNNPIKISERIPPERINSGIKELRPFVISSNDTDKSVTIVTD